ncbi:MAG: hypothetical protein ACKVU2_12745 [Saprospiraceae bacterium]
MTHSAEKIPSKVIFSPTRRTFGNGSGHIPPLTRSPAHPLTPLTRSHRSHR